MEPTLFSDAELADEVSEEELAIYFWRVERLRGLGLSPILAEAFASLVDWHELEALVEGGCPPELALEIVR